FSSRGRQTRSKRDWSSDVCSSDLFVDAVKLLHQTGPILRRAQKRDRLPHDQGIGMMVEGQSGGAAAQPVRFLTAPGQKTAVAQIDRKSVVEGTGGVVGCGRRRAAG